MHTAPLSPDDIAVVGGYELLHRIGHGGMGQVYLGESPGGEPTAVEVIKPSVVGSEDLAEVRPKRREPQDNPGSSALSRRHSEYAPRDQADLSRFLSTEIARPTGRRSAWLAP